MMKLRSLQSESEKENRVQGSNLFKNNPLPENEILSQVGLFQKRQELSKVLFLNDIYQKIINVHGSIMEFGCRWGQNLITLSNLRGIYEPYNYNRKIIGFDTFEGFKDISSVDGKDDSIEEGAFGVTKDYDFFLEELMSYHQSESPLNHIKKFDICKGNVSDELPKYLNKYPETIIALAYFDFDLYEPTKNSLEIIKKHLVKGSILVFDELNDPGFPGETLALNEIMGLNNIKLQRNKFSALQSYYIYE
jgi:hypothetical protein